MPDPTSRRHALLFIATFSLPSLATPPQIPDHLVGFWTTADAEYAGHELKKGTGMYLSKSGRGAIIGGWIGFRIEATFDAATNQLAFDAYDGPKKGPSGKLIFDPSRGVLVDERKPADVWHRRATTIPPGLRKQLGIE